MLRALSAAAVLLAAPLALAGGKPHPDVAKGGDPDACLACHAEATPEVVKAWEGGRHGLLLVKCFVCHGSRGKDFALRPAAARCTGCHAAEVASVVAVKTAKEPKGTVCFACHAPHALSAAEGAASPHPAR